MVRWREQRLGHRLEGQWPTEVHEQQALARGSGEAKHERAGTEHRGIEKTLAGANADTEHRAQKRITNGVMGLVWMVLASVIVGTITAIAVAYGLIEKPF